MPELSEVQIDGSGDVESEDVFTTDEVYFGISGYGSLIWRLGQVVLMST